MLGPPVLAFGRVTRDLVQAARCSPQMGAGFFTSSLGCHNRLPLEPLPIRPGSGLTTNPALATRWWLF